MAHKMPLPEHIDLRGLDPAPAQVWGGVRLIPLLRREIREDLRLARRGYDEDLAVVALDGKQPLAGAAYASYIPHALIASWSNDGAPAAAYGGQLMRRDGETLAVGPCTVRIAHRMARREDRNRMRFLPMHLAMEGFLALHFGGPDIAWSEYARDTLSYGLGCRVESAIPGRLIQGLEDALRVFEIHERQVGVLILVADAMASAFVTPHPDDYRALHRSLIEDFYGELLYRYGLLYPDPGPMAIRIDDSAVGSLGELRRGLARARDEWAAFHARMAEGIFNRRITPQIVIN